MELDKWKQAVLKARILKGEKLPPSMKLAISIGGEDENKLPPGTWFDATVEKILRY